MSSSDDKKKPIKKKVSAFQNILQNLAGDTKYTSIERYKYPKVKNETFPKRNYNEMADLLMLPKSESSNKKDCGYSYLLTMVDIWSNYCDMEPLKTKTAKETLEAMLRIFKRHYLDPPSASLITDNGGEFKEVFDKWLKDHDILHRFTKPDRHKQLGNIENLNRLVGKIIMTYLTNQEMENDKPCTDWVPLIPKIREQLNDIKTHPKDKDPFTTPMNISKLNLKTPPKYKVGDLVHYVIEKPDDGKFGAFRSGDRRYSKDVKKIKFVLIYSSPNPYRYLLDGVPNVSYAEAELIPTKSSEQTYTILKIIDKKTEKGKVYFKVWWKRYKKSESTWQSEEQLKEDGAQEYIDEYENSLKEKNKK
jgi:transposase InsO family protein